MSILFVKENTVNCKLFAEKKKVYQYLLAVVSNCYFSFTYKIDKRVYD